MIRFLSFVIAMSVGLSAGHTETGATKSKDGELQPRLMIKDL
jgi:hypothetical protein